MRRHRRSSRSSAVVLTQALLLLGSGLLGGTAWAAGYTTRFPLDECPYSD